jgi:hypothetical protein
MGGGFYERPVQTTSSSSGSCSQASRAALSQRRIHADCNVKGKTLVATGGQPIVICFDVTGSMGDWPRVIYDKLPMFFGQVMMKGYLSNPNLAFMAIGDGSYHQQIQCSDFASGTEIDVELKKMYLAGNGQGSPENYEFGAYFLSKHADFKNADSKPFFFLIGDAKYFPSLSPGAIDNIFGDSVPNTVDSKSLWDDVLDKTNTFYFHKAYSGKGSSSDIASLQQWTAALGADRIMQLDNAKAVVDAMLGVVSISSGARTLETYVEDMVERGQDDERIKQVSECLNQCASAMAAVDLTMEDDLA